MAAPEISSLVALDILLLWQGTPGSMIKSADLDARLKTLIDALRMPWNKDEIETNVCDAVNEDPFFCLMEDDKLVSDIKTSTDTLLETIASNDVLYKNDARIFIAVNYDVRPKLLGGESLI